MELDQVLSILQSVSPVVNSVLMTLGTLVVLGTAYVKITPTQDDDTFLLNLEQKPIIGSLLKALVQFSPISRRNPNPFAEK